ncbi:MAG: thioesterase [Anaerolineaceae bacterium]|nr:thioesterase [Anaerolineaceae bacterium]
MTHRPLTTPWLMPFSRGQNGRLRLFFFPHAGGGASTFFQWSRMLPEYVTSYAVQLPGRETRLRDTLHHQVDTVVQALAQALPPFLDRPFVFWGHSMGALLSYEVAQRLRRQGLPLPQRLIVSGLNAPHVPYADPHIHHLPEAEFVTALEGLNGTSPTVLQNAELRSLVLPMIRADFQMVETYAYREAAPLPCPITVLDAVDDEKTDEAGLQEWQQQSTELLEMFTFPGNHFFLYDLQPTLINTVGNLLKRQMHHQQRL